MTLWMVAGLVTTVAALGYGLHRAALWAEGRGWIYYKAKPQFRGSSLGLLESIYHPAVEHVIEERAGQGARADQAESGDDPPPATTADSPGSSRL